ncbi:Hypothetical protein R9X50_00256200 [Acrodontium crateriforme]|uniref:Homeobox domain-containing protein n=1 Tax=Acrodontium crateriforme TaxID=150365 RepID=A0AAQ3R6S5_9PEZI|nr:Hypothetical protein R9X50_00256200 [Acrodontium crateriforme]
MDFYTGQPAFVEAELGRNPIACDIKPRLTKEQHDVLEEHFQKQSKPNTNTKKSFAETLNVPLEKINNWFQNRRAKSKQDAKKQAETLSMFNAQQQESSQHGSSLTFSSESEASPVFPSADYYSMMQQHCSSVEQMPNGHQETTDSHPQDFQYAVDLEQFHAFERQQQQLSINMFNSPQELQRRTLTQEQFDAFSQHGPDFNQFAHGIPAENGSSAQLFSGFPNGGLKQQATYGLPMAENVPIPRVNSSMPSIITDMSDFISINAWDDLNISTTSSEWPDSRSSSMSLAQPEIHFQHVHQEPVSTGSQWQPGQSVPVDFNALSQEFRQVAQSRQPSQMQPQVQEQPLAWPDDAFARRDSSASLLVQQMSHVGINTPQPQQAGSFKPPPPPSSSIAVRRQRPKPAALGLASLRSQSYNGSTQPLSPGQTQSGPSAPGQTIRRIRSSNVINGIAQGRVQKQNPGAAQRSPLAWNLAGSLSSPKAARHSSSSSQSGSLAPPTPLSPHGGSLWQNSERHPNISESDFEQTDFFDNFMPAKDDFSSPPHTPMLHQIAQHRIANSVINENTPPQSAPATQSCFPSSIYSQQQHLKTISQPHEFANGAIADMFPMSNVTFMPNQRFVVPKANNSAETLPMQFANSSSMVSAQGQLTLGFPSQTQFVQTPQEPSGPAQGQFGQFSIAKTPPVPVQQPSKPASESSNSSTELLVHEYNPPEDVKRAAFPRKPLPSEPRNYTFSNHGPEHFGKEKKRPGAPTLAANDSPLSNSSGNASS